MTGGRTFNPEASRTPSPERDSIEAADVSIGTLETSRAGPFSHDHAMHSWIFRHILQLEAIYGRRAQERAMTPSTPLAPPADGLLPIHVLIPQPRMVAPRRAA